MSNQTNGHHHPAPDDAIRLTEAKPPSKKRKRGKVKQIRLTSLALEGVEREGKR